MQKLCQHMPCWIVRMIEGAGVGIFVQRQTPRLSRELHVL